ncbi:MAG: protein tyrosine phosphatase, partial [Bacteroidetes bacterium HGW-Bacteroidetes-22]
MKILIICTGNSCRSQMAHGWLQWYNPALEVFSAGTFPEKEVNPMAIEVMAELGIDISGHKPVSVEEYLEEKWDFVVSVCDDTLETCPTFNGKVRHRLHKGFEDPARFRGTPEQVKAKYLEVRDEII